MSSTNVPLVVAALRAGATLDDLRARYALAVSRAVLHPNLVLLKYDQLESPLGDPLVRQCRGLIVDEADGYRVVSRSFDKFWNHGEVHADAVDFATATVQEKLDGSLCVLYHHDGAWRVQTSGSADAAGPVGRTGRRFCDLFWEVFAAMSYDLPTDPRRCYSFELMTPWNRVVIPHTTSRLVLIGVRDRESGEELPLDGHGFEVVRAFPLRSLPEILETFAALPPLRQEGYVVVDAAWRRVKVKHPGYVALHHLKDGLGPRRIMAVVQCSEVDEVLSAFPEFAEDFTRTSAAFDGLVAELEDAYARLRGIANQKEFALEATKTRFPRALFQVRAGRSASVRAVLRDTPPEALLRALGLRDEGA